jgi:hypothetical protein
MVHYQNQKIARSSNPIRTIQAQFSEDCSMKKVALWIAVPGIDDNAFQ